MFSWTHPRQSPLIVAHRGASAAAPENTLAAFRRAIDDGAEAIELDVQLTKEGKIVVFHDAQLRRTTNGNGRVSKCTLAEIKRLSAGAWFNKSFLSEKIPTLHEVFDLVHRGIGINIEIKSDVRHRRRFDIVERCCAIIRQHRREPQVLVSSFHHHYVKQVKRLLPEVTTGLLFHPLKHLGRSWIHLARQAEAEFMIFGGGTLRKYIVQRAHEQRLYIGEYTVNTGRRFSCSLRYGVDAIITDDPAAIRRFRTHK